MLAQTVYMVAETNQLPADVCIELLGELAVPVSVAISFIEESATFEDFHNTDLSFTFDATSSASQCFQLDIAEDDLLESDETFSISLSTRDPVVEILMATAAVTIQDTSMLDVGFESLNGSVTEGDTFLACVRIISGRLAEQFLLPLSVQVLTGGEGNRIYWVVLYTNALPPEIGGPLLCLPWGLH